MGSASRIEKINGGAEGLQKASRKFCMFICAHETFVLQKDKNEIGEKNNQILFCFNGEICYTSSKQVHVFRITVGMKVKVFIHDISTT